MPAPGVKVASLSAVQRAPQMEDPAAKTHHSSNIDDLPDFEVIVGLESCKEQLGACGEDLLIAKELQNPTQRTRSQLQMKKLDSEVYRKAAQKAVITVVSIKCPHKMPRRSQTAALRDSCGSRTSAYMLHHEEIIFLRCIPSSTSSMRLAPKSAGSACRR